MQSNNKWRIFAIAAGFICLVCLIVIVIGYFYVANLPPNPLSDSGYYVRLTKVYYHPAFPASAFEIEEADIRTFEILDDSQGYAKDRNHVYLNGNVIPEANPATFELLEEQYTRDQNYVYLNERIFSNDPVNFEFLSSFLMRDSQHIYWSDKIISDDP